MKSILVSTFILSFTIGNSQTNSEVEELVNANTCDSAKKSLITSAPIESEFQSPAHIALSYFPELANTQIKFRKARISTTLNTRPTIGSLLFKSKSNRKYIIRINDRKQDSSILFYKVPYKAQVGIIGHEYAHILDYSQKNIFQILGRLFSYASKSRKSEFEREIDMLTIEKGLGNELYEWSNYILNESDASKEYKKFKRKTYLTPKEILEEMKKTEH